MSVLVALLHFTLCILSILYKREILTNRQQPTREKHTAPNKIKAKNEQRSRE